MWRGFIGHLKCINILQPVDVWKAWNRKMGKRKQADKEHKSEVSLCGRRKPVRYGW